LRYTNAPSRYSGQIPERTRESLLDLLVRYVVTTLFNPVHDACDREGSALQPDKDEEDGVISLAGLPQELELGAPGVREDRLRAERRARIQQGPPELLGLVERRHIRFGRLLG